MPRRKQLTGGGEQSYLLLLTLYNEARSWQAAVNRVACCSWCYTMRLTADRQQWAAAGFSWRSNNEAHSWQAAVNSHQLLLTLKQWGPQLTGSSEQPPASPDAQTMRPTADRRQWTVASFSWRSNNEAHSWQAAVNSRQLLLTLKQWGPQLTGGSQQSRQLLLSLNND